MTIENLPLGNRTGSFYTLYRGAGSPKPDPVPPHQTSNHPAPEVQ